eukprot:13623-Amphidinium_carterae.1
MATMHRHHKRTRIRFTVSEQAANQLKTFSEYDTMTRTTFLGHLLRLPPTDAMYQCVLTPEGTDILHTLHKRAGRPRIARSDSALKRAHRLIEATPYTPEDLEDLTHRARRSEPLRPPRLVGYGFCIGHGGVQ